jgi:hypothetical protein
MPSDAVEAPEPVSMLNDAIEAPKLKSMPADASIASMQLRHRPLSDAGFSTGEPRLRCKAIEHRCASVGTTDQINFADENP